MWRNVCNLGFQEACSAARASHEHGTTLKKTVWLWSYHCEPIDARRKDELNDFDCMIRVGEMGNHRLRRKWEHVLRLQKKTPSSRPEREKISIEYTYIIIWDEMKIKERLQIRSTSDCGQEYCHLDIYQGFYTFLSRVLLPDQNLGFGWRGSP